MKNIMSKTYRNAFAGIAEIFITSIFSFIIVRFTIQYFTDQTNGVIRLSSQIINYFNVAQGALAVAFSFFLYLPLKQNNEKQIIEYFYKVRMYFRVLGLIYIALLLLSLLIFPPLIINANFWSTNHLYYSLILLFVGSLNIATFFLSSKYTIFIKSNERDFINKIINIFIDIFVYVSALLIMFLWHGNKFYILLPLGILSSRYFIMGLIKKRYVKKHFSFLFTNDIPKLSRDKKIEKMMWAAAFQTIAALLLFSLDEVVISLHSRKTGIDNAMLNVSVYAAYLMLFSVLLNIAKIIISSFEATLGHMVAENKKVKAEVYNNFNRVAHIIALPIAATFIFTSHFLVPFLFNANNIDAYKNMNISIIFGISLFILIITTPSDVMVNTLGMLKKTLKFSLIEGLVNLTLSLILMWFLGIVGVALATMIAVSLKHIFLKVFLWRFTDGYDKFKSSILDYVITINLMIIFILSTYFNVFSFSDDWKIILYMIGVGTTITLLSICLYLICDKKWVTETLQQIPFVKHFIEKEK